MIGKNLIDKDMEVPFSGMSKDLIKYINWITNLAKTKYKVNMGPLFSTRSGIRLAKEDERKIGASKFTVKVILVPNDSAFDAIDASKQAELNKIEAEVAKEKYRMLKESYDRQIEAQEQITDEGDVLPLFLPRINVQC